MSLFTLDQIKALAPDAASLSAANGLAKAHDWSLLAFDAAGTALWGEIKGSGKTPYQARIDLSEPAFKCSCPSRKFPCKHGLALLMVHTQQPNSFVAADIPTWVSDWLDARQNKASAPSKVAAKEAALADLSDLEREAIALKEAKKADKQAANKAQKAAAGVAQCGLFLQDVVRTGLSQLAQKTDGFETLAAQLVDAQLPGLARLLRQAASVPFSGAGWESRLLGHIATIELILSAQRQREAALEAKRACTLPEPLLADLDQALGYTVAQESVLAQDGVQDCWQVLGHVVDHESQVSSRRTVLMGLNSGRFAIMLTFSAGNQPLPAPWPVGECYDATLAFYPSAVPLRALPKGTMQRVNGAQSLAFSKAQSGIAHALSRYAQALAQLPWLACWPLVLQGVCLQSGASSAADSVVDATSPSAEMPVLALPLSPSFQQFWRCMALTGNAPCTLAGEWDGHTFLPLSLHHEGQCFALNEPLLAGNGLGPAQ